MRKPMRYVCASELWRCFNMLDCRGGRPSIPPSYALRGVLTIVFFHSACGLQAAKAAKKAAEFEEHKAINAEVVARITAPYRYACIQARCRPFRVL